MAGRTGRRRVLRALAALSIAGAAASVAACSPIQTQVPYAPSDGVRVTLGDQITIENLLILTTAQGEPALVVGGITNRTGDQTSVTLDFGEGAQSTIGVVGGGTALLDPSNPDGELLSIDTISVPPGAVLPVTVSTAESGATVAQVPVLDGTLEPYGEYLEMLAAADTVEG